MKVLVIEDEPHIADFLVRGLREEGFAVDHAADGPTAAVSMRQGTWDAIVLDWGLPDADGLQLLKDYRAQGGDNPVLFLTARDAVSDRIAGLDSGADDYLCKPFSFDELHARIRALVRRKEQWCETIVTYDDIAIDVAAHTVSRAGVRIELTAKEEAILLLLLRYPGRVFSRTQLYERIWDERYDGVSNTLEVHIMSLRRKLESRGTRIIHTQRGRGYVLETRSPSEVSR